MLRAKFQNFYSRSFRLFFLAMLLRKSLALCIKVWMKRPKKSLSSLFLLRANFRLSALDINKDNGFVGYMSRLYPVDT